jgi:amino acid adenylation domain-containing protein
MSDGTPEPPSAWRAQGSTGSSSPLDAASRASHRDTSAELGANARWQLSLNRTSRPYPREIPIHRLFADWVRRTPHAPAVAFGEGVLTYADLDQRAKWIRDELTPLVSEGSIVAIFGDRSPDIIAALLAILELGAAYLPLSRTDPLHRIIGQLRDSAATLVLADASTDLPPLISQQWRVVELGHHARGRGTITSQRRVDVPATSLAYVMYTSGSTGAPKGVAVTHRNVVRLVRGQNYVGFRRSDVFLHLAPLAFDASTLEIWGALLNGACLALAPPGLLSLREIARAIERANVTTLWLTSGLFSEMVEAELPTLSRVPQVLSGGDIVAPTHVRRLLGTKTGVRFVNGYGPTEATTFTCSHAVEHVTDVDAPLPIGRPLANTQVFVMDSHERLVGPHVEGEIYIGGDGVARGYLNPQLTRERFRFVPLAPGHPPTYLYKTGDIGRFRQDGTLEFLGRSDAQVKVRGYRVELGEVETALRAQAGIAQAVALTHRSRAGSASVIAFVVRTGDAAPSASALASSLSNALPGYMIPVAFFDIDTVPLNSTGKIDRGALASLVESGMARRL